MADWLNWTGLDYIDRAWYERIGWSWIISA